MAEEELGVAALLDVEDLVRQPDQLSVITYLAQLYHRLQGKEGEGGRKCFLVRTMVSVAVSSTTIIN